MPPLILNQQLIFLSFAWEHVCSWLIWAKLLSSSCLKQGGYGGHMVHLQIGARASYHSKVILHLHTGSRYGPTFCSPASNNVRPTWHHFSLLCPYCTLSYITVRPLHFCYCFVKCMWGYSSSCVCNCDMSMSPFENIWSHGYTRISYPAKEKVAQWPFIASPHRHCWSQVCQHWEWTPVSLEGTTR